MLIRRLPIAFALALCWPVTSPAQDQAGSTTRESDPPTVLEDNQNQDTGSEPPSLLEEITITGQRPLRSMRIEIENAENLVNSLYNDLNDNDEFDVECREETHLGSFISERVCEPMFMKRLREENVQDYIRGFDELLSDHELKSVYLNIVKAFQADMERLALENPELFQAIKNHSDLKRAYQAEREERFKHQFFSF